jgi:sortase B
VFSVYITPGNNDRDDFFPFVRSKFSSDRDYMEYIYQIRVRSHFNIDNVDINENDQILTLSTCSYELSNYRTIVVARKVREGEDATVDTDSIIKNKKALNPPSFYKHYGGKAPEIPTFEAALEDGQIPWYNPMER